MTGDNATIAAKALNLLRRGQLGEATRTLSSTSETSADIEVLTGRLRRLCVQAVEKATTPDQIAALVPVIVFVSPGDQVAPALSTMLARQMSAGEPDTAQVDRWLGAVAPLLAERQVTGPLFDAVLEMAATSSDASVRTSVLLALCAKWREKGYEGLSDERLLKLSELLPAAEAEVASAG